MHKSTTALLKFYKHIQHVSLWLLKFDKRILTSTFVENRILSRYKTSSNQFLNLDSLLKIYHADYGYETFSRFRQLLAILLKFFKLVN